jgi:hypothetical protein
VGSLRDCTWVLGLSGFRVVTINEGETSHLVIRIERRAVRRYTCSRCGRRTGHVRSIRDRTWDDLPWATHHVTLVYRQRRIVRRPCGVRTERMEFADAKARITRRLRQQIGVDCQSMPTSHAGTKGARRFGFLRPTRDDTTDGQNIFFHYSVMHDDLEQQRAFGDPNGACGIPRDARCDGARAGSKHPHTSSAVRREGRQCGEFWYGVPQLGWRARSATPPHHFRRSVAQHDGQERGVNLQAAVVVNEPELPKRIHEEVDTRARRPDHLGQDFLRHSRKRAVRRFGFPVSHQPQQRTSQPFLARVEQLVDQIFVDSDVPRQHVRQETNRECGPGVELPYYFLLRDA